MVNDHAGAGTTVADGKAPSSYERMHCQQESDFPAFLAFPAESMVLPERSSPYG